MSEQPAKRWSVRSVVNTTVIVLVLYVLSIGPIAWIVTMTELEMDHPFVEIMDYFYSPLYFLCNNSDVINSAIDWYLDLWTP